MKALIIEDETIIRTGIVNKVDWQKFQIFKVIEADNGETGYEITISEKPDIIMLDINLPKLNGIEFLKKIREHDIDSRVIILSGHDNFEYAQQAIKYGVENYLLKPCSIKQIEEIILKVCKNINASCEKEMKYQEMKKKLNDMVPFFKSGLINSIITGDVSNEAEVIELAQYFDIDITNEYFIVAVVLLENNFSNDRSPEEGLINKVEVCHLINQVTNLENVIIDNSLSNKVLLLMSGNHEGELKKHFFTIVDNIVKQTSTRTNINLAIGIGYATRGINNIRHSYNGALMALESRFVDDESRIYYIDDIILYNSSLSNYPYEDEKKFLACLKTGINDNAILSLDSLMLFLHSKKDKYPVTLIKIHLKQLVFYMMQIVYEFGGNISDIYGNVNLLERIEDFKHIDEFRQFLLDFTDKLCEYISKKRYLKHTSILRKVITFIEQNYADESMNLEKIADYVNMHPNYISHLFNKEKGESLTSYICRFRINKAGEMILKSDALKICDVAYEVGFSDAHYFTTCFKNIIGVTPSQYGQLRKN